jgi:hypothetical protein
MVGKSTQQPQHLGSSCPGWLFDPVHFKIPDVDPEPHQFPPSTMDTTTGERTGADRLARAWVHQEWITDPADLPSPSCASEVYGLHEELAAHALAKTLGGVGG